MLKLHFLKNFAAKTVFASLAFLAVWLFVFATQAKADSLPISSVSRINEEDGRAEISFEPQAEPYYLLVFHENALGNFEQVYLEEIADPSLGTAHFAVPNFGEIRAEEIRHYYFAIIPRGDYEDYTDNLIVKNQALDGENLKIEWTRADITTGYFYLYKQALSRSLSIKDVKATNSTNPSTPYLAKAGQDITVTFKLNTLNVAISNLNMANSNSEILGLNPGLSFVSTGVADAQGFYTHTVTATLSPIAQAEGFYQGINFSFDIVFDCYGVPQITTIDQASPLVNQDAPLGESLSQYAPVPTADIVTEVSVSSLLQGDDVFSLGDTVHLTYEYAVGASNYSFSVSSLKINDITVDPQTYIGLTDNGVSFVIKPSYGLDANDELSLITLVVQDIFGETHHLNMSNGSSFKYVPPTSSPTYELDVSEGYESAAGIQKHIGVFSGTQITYTLKTNNNLVLSTYVLSLNTSGSAQPNMELGLELLVDENGLAIETADGKYTYSKSIVIEDTFFGGLSQDKTINVVKITKNGTNVNLTTSFAKKVIYYSKMQFEKVKYQVLKSKISNTMGPDADNKFYAVNWDCIFFEINLTQPMSSSSSITVAGITGKMVPAQDFERHLQKVGALSTSNGLILSLNADGKILRGLFMMPKIDIAPEHEKQLDVTVSANYAQLEGAAIEISTAEADDLKEPANVNKLIYWNPIDANNFGFSMSTNSLLASGYVTKGDEIALSYSGITAHSVYAVKAGNREILLNTQESQLAGQYTFALSESNEEGYTSASKIMLSLTFANEAGKQYKIMLSGTRSLIYVLRSSQEIDHLELGFDPQTKPSSPLPAHYALHKNSNVTFTFTSNDIYQRNYSIVIKHPSGENTQTLSANFGQPIEGEPINGYKYTYTISAGQMQAFADLEELILELSYEKTPEDRENIQFTDNLEGLKLIYYADFDIKDVRVSYHNGQNPNWEPTDNFAYIKDGELIRIEMLFNHSLGANGQTLVRPEAAAISSYATEVAKTQLEEFISRPWSYKSNMGMQFYLDTTDVLNDTLVCLYRVPKPGDENYEQHKLSFQRSNENDPVEMDEVPLNIYVGTERLQVPGNVSIIYAPKRDLPGNEEEQRDYHQIIYWAPLEIWRPSATLFNGGENPPIDDLGDEKYSIVKDGQQLRVTFTTKHPVITSEIKSTILPSGTITSQKQEMQLNFTQQIIDEEWYVYTAIFNMGQEPTANFADQTIIKFSWQITDARGGKNKSAIRDEEHSSWAIYYKPLVISEITILTSNKKDETMFCKDEDTITVSFMANHFAMLDGQSIVNKEGQHTPLRRRHVLPVKYSFSYKVENGDIKDLAFATFAFMVSDLAGDNLEFSHNSPGVINQIKYYAPLEFSAAIASSNPRPEYAKNEDTITISTKTNHEAQSLDFRLGSREIGDNQSYRENPVVSYRIPANEQALYEGEMFFSVRLEDPAGNYEVVSESQQNSKDAKDATEASKVIYDRTAPEVKILPGFSGFSKDDVGFTFMYTDMYLDMQSLSCLLNQRQRIGVFGETQTSYSHNVKLSEEGKYVINARAMDMAGNEMEFDATCHLIIDKTSPIIKMELKRNTFKVGFTLDNITDIEETYLGNLICTVTDNAGVQDWALDLPIEDEGKKTVFTMARDMAGNTSTPIIYDIFIDGTAPQPFVKNSDTGELLLPLGENFFVGTAAKMSLSLAPIFMGDESPDQFTSLKLVDESGNLVFDFLEKPNEEQSYTYKFKDFGRYSLLVAAKDSVGNITEPLLYTIEFREKYILEILLEKTPMASWLPIGYINNTVFFALCAALAIVSAVLVTALVKYRIKKKKYMAQEYVVID